MYCGSGEGIQASLGITRWWVRERILGVVSSTNTDSTVLNQSLFCRASAWLVQNISCESTGRKSYLVLMS